MKTRKKPRPLEKIIQRAICDYLHNSGYCFWRSNNNPIFSFGGSNNNLAPRFRSLPKYTPRGLPDIEIIIAGHFIGMEVKRPGNPLRPEQATFGAKIMKHGATYCVVHSVEEVIEFLSAFPKPALYKVVLA